MRWRHSLTLDTLNPLKPNSACLSKQLQIRQTLYVNRIQVFSSRVMGSTLCACERRNEFSVVSNGSFRRRGLTSNTRTMSRGGGAQQYQQFWVCGYGKRILLKLITSVWFSPDRTHDMVYKQIKNNRNVLLFSIFQQAPCVIKKETLGVGAVGRF